MRNVAVLFLAVVGSIIIRWHSDESWWCFWGELAILSCGILVGIYGERSAQKYRQEYKDKHKEQQ